MDTEKCKILLNVLETGSFSATAEQMGYTPSGISRSIETMEKQAGFPIVTRSYKGVKLTKEGEELLPIVRKLSFWSSRYDQMTAKLCGMDVGIVQVGTAYAHYYGWLCKVVASFHDAYPNIKVEIIEGTSSELSEKMDERRLDFAIVSKRRGHHRWIELVEDEFVIMISRKNPISEAERISPKVLLSEPYIEIYPGRETDNTLLFRKMGIQPETRFATTDARGAYVMVREGLGICLVNGLLVKCNSDDVAMIPLDPPQFMELGVMLPEEEITSPAAACFADYAMKRMSEIIGK